jgi:hypothetical protein
MGWVISLIDGQSVLIVSLSVIELLDAFGCWGPFFLESLILAQDERWRRA